MKIRTDFVTNSSSSSFVIAYKPTPNYDEETLKKYPLLRAYDTIMTIIMESEDNCDTSAAEVFTNLDEYNKWFCWEWHYEIKNVKQNDGVLSFESEKWLQKEYNKVVQYLKQGFYIANKSVGYHDSLGDILRSIADNNDDFVLIDED